MSLNSGMYFSTGSDAFTRPSSITIMAATPRIGLVDEAMWNIASALYGFLVGNTLCLEIDHFATTGDTDYGVMYAALVNELLDDIVDAGSDRSPDIPTSSGRCTRQFERGHRSSAFLWVADLIAGRGCRVVLLKSKPAREPEASPILSWATLQVSELGAPRVYDASPVGEEVAEWQTGIPIGFTHQTRSC